MNRMKAARLTVLSACLVAGTVARADDDLRRAGLLGVRLGLVTEQARRDRKLEGGTLIIEVLPGSAAQEVGLEAGDVITGCDGLKVPGTAEFLAAISRRKGGEKTTVVLDRAGRVETKEVTLKPRPLESGNEAYDVVYGSVASRGGRLRTIATRPKRPGKFPTLYLIQGIGGYSIEDAPAGVGPYRRFIDEFARQGYVTFRVEKPGQGDSEGGPTRDIDFETELDGYRQGLKALAANSSVDGRNIVIFGHSMGGVMAPLIADTVPVKGIAVYGTVAKTWYEYFGENFRRQAMLEGRSASRIDVERRRDAVIFANVFAGGKSPLEVAMADPELSERIEQLFVGGKYLGGQHYAYFRQLAATNVAAAWERFGGHALAMWGKSEYIATEADHAMIASIVNHSQTGRGTFLAIDSADHGFRRVSSAEEAFRDARAGKSGEFNPAVLTALRGWADEVIGVADAG